MSSFGCITSPNSLKVFEISRHISEKIEQEEIFEQAITNKIFY
jgi:hypothetical protein